METVRAVLPVTRRTRILVPMPRVRKSRITRQDLIRNSNTNQRPCRVERDQRTRERLQERPQPKSL